MRKRRGGGWGSGDGGDWTLVIVSVQSTTVGQDPIIPEMIDM